MKLSQIIGKNLERRFEHLKYECENKIADLGEMVYQNSKLVDGSDEYDYSDDIFELNQKLFIKQKEYEDLITEIHDIVKEHPEHIPNDICYCYDQNGTCPYWTLSPFEVSQDNGVCIFMNYYDREGIGLIWDQVKQCGVNEEDLKENDVL
jgi:hypothetical protein